MNKGGGEWERNGGGSRREMRGRGGVRGEGGMESGSERRREGGKGGCDEGEEQ